VIRCKINFCVLNFFLRFVGSPEALKIENSHMKVKNWSCPNISMWYFFKFQIARWFKKCKNLVVWRSTLNVTGWNWSKFGEIWKFHIFWPYLTSSGWNWPSNTKICTFSESASNLQSEKAPCRYIGQLQYLTIIWEFSIKPNKNKLSTHKLILHLTTAF
jgi:hypothetical protein